MQAATQVMPPKVVHIHYMALLSGLISIKQRNTSEMANMLPA